MSRCETASPSTASARAVAVVAELVLVDLGAAVVGIGVGVHGAGLGEARLVDLGGGVIERIGRAARPALRTALLGALAIAGHLGSS